MSKHFQVFPKTAIIALFARITQTKYESGFVESFVRSGKW